MLNLFVLVMRMEIDDMENPVIKYDCIYIPNPLILKHIKPHETFTSFEEMMKVCRPWLEQEAKKADDNDTQFTPYKCRYVLKPEFVQSGGAEEDGDI